MKYLIKRKSITVIGIVQGVGFRPFVYNLALKYHLVGFVYNGGDGVHIEVEGEKKSIESFFNALETIPPALSRIDKLSTHSIEPLYEKEFVIQESKNSQTQTMLLPDSALCKKCEAEMNDPTNRRYRYPFINCIECGPRYSIINSFPYDRANTSMRSFTMCSECEAEYNNPQDRRYHAQPISCFSCGPKLSFSLNNSEFLEGDALDRAVKLIKEGGICAIKGMGGFHLVCDATKNESVKELRRRKNRPSKPFAVMFRDMEQLKHYKKLSTYEESVITSKEAPITLLDGTIETLSKEIAPKIEKIGIFLPYTPLHKLLLEHLERPLVVTSANLSDEPIVTTSQEILEKLGGIIDGILDYDREIVNSCDDSVVAVVENESLLYRLSRSYAPKSFFMREKSTKKVLAVGANQKATFALAFENHIVLSPHIGDINSISSYEHYEKILERFKSIYAFTPDLIVCDKHPEYETTKYAKHYVEKHPSVELIELQHHYAHTLSVMAEYKLNEEVLAFSFDGTGYGDDTTLWGGEVFLATPMEYKREFHLQHISLLGGAKAIKEPRRVGVALLFEVYSFEEVQQHPLAQTFSRVELKLLYKLYTNSLNSPKSSSIGRLFDGIYALMGNYEVLGYEGESGLIVEAMAKRYPSQESYSFELRDGVIEYSHLIKKIVEEPNKELIASKFLNTLVALIVEITSLYADKKVVLSGGVFQNTTLVQKLMRRFESLDRELYIQKETPINDGSIALGQAYYGYMGYIKNKTKG